MLTKYGVPLLRFLHDSVICPFDHYLASWLMLLDDEDGPTTDCNLFCPCDVGA